MNAEDLTKALAEVKQHFLDGTQTDDAALQRATLEGLIRRHAPGASIVSADHLAGLMATTPTWAKGLPLAAAGFEATRYRKE